MAVLASLIECSSFVSLFALAQGTALVLITTFLLHRAFWHPLSRIPGPLICKFTSSWIWYHTYIGDDCTLIRKLHEKYGPILRIGPNDCVIADGAALAPIYSERGGFLKDTCYANFMLEGHHTIFSTSDPSHRAIRSKAVTPLFSTSSIRSKHDVFERCAKRFVERIKDDARAGMPVNMLMLCRRLTLEAVCSVLFETPYGSIDEVGDRLSAAVFVDSAVAVGKFFFLPHWLFEIVETIRAKLFAASQADNASIAIVDDFGHILSADLAQKPGTYQARLKEAGVSDHEIEVQCKDIIFAGTDSTGTVLASTCWYLARSPDVWQKLKAEITAADAKDPTYNPQSLTYLDAVVREGLRLARANPSRFPRIVPSTGWAFNASNGKTYYFPPGTSIGCAPLTLHFNASVFPDPTAFHPERWLHGATPEMQRDLIPFNLGPRQCIARNMAQYELLVTVRELARHSILDGAKAVGDEIEIMEWFNSRIKGDKIEVEVVL